MTNDDSRTGYIRRDFLRDDLQPRLLEDGLTYLHCPDWSCGHFTILPIDEAHWVCPIHGGAGVAP